MSRQGRIEDAVPHFGEAPVLDPGCGIVRSNPDETLAALKKRKDPRSGWEPTPLRVP